MTEMRRQRKSGGALGNTFGAGSAGCSETHADYLRTRDRKDFHATPPPPMARRANVAGSGTWVTGPGGAPPGGGGGGPPAGGGGGPPGGAWNANPMATDNMRTASIPKVQRVIERRFISSSCGSLTVPHVSDDSTISNRPVFPVCALNCLIPSTYTFRMLRCQWYQRAIYPVPSL